MDGALPAIHVHLGGEKTPGMGADFESNGGNFDRPDEAVDRSGQAFDLPTRISTESTRRISHPA